MTAFFDTIISPPHNQVLYCYTTVYFIEISIFSPPHTRIPVSIPSISSHHFFVTKNWPIVIADSRVIGFPPPHIWWNPQVNPADLDVINYIRSKTISGFSYCERVVRHYCYWWNDHSLIVLQLFCGLLDP